MVVIFAQAEKKNRAREGRRDGEASSSGGLLVVVGLGLESGWWMPPSYGWRPGAVRADEDARFYCGVLSFSLRLKFDPTFLLKFTSRGREPAW